MSGFAERGYAVRRAAELARQRPASVLLVVVLTALTLAALLLTVALAAAARDWIAQAPAGPEISLFIKPGTAARELESLRTRLGALEGVAAVRLVPRDQALAELARRTGVGVGEGRSNPLPDVLVARYPLGTDTDAIGRAAAEAQSWPGVDAVRADNAGYQRLQLVARQLREAAGGAGWAVLGALLLAAALALAQLAAPDRGHARLLALLGARPAFVARPYAYVAAAATAAGAVLGTGSAHLLLAWAAPRLMTAAAALGPTPVWHPLPLPAALLAVAATALAGGLAAGLICRIVLRLNSE